MIPGIGTLYQALTIATGNDPVAGRCLSQGERVLGALSLGINGLPKSRPKFESPDVSDKELRRLVNSIFEAGGYAKSQQTVAALRTAEGPIIVATNSSFPLNEKQFERLFFIQDNLDARGLWNSLIPVTSFAGYEHAEMAAVRYAQDVGLSGTIIATTNFICGSRCAPILKKLGIKRASCTNLSR